MKPVRSSSVVLAMASLLFLTGCGSLLGGGKRDTLFRFGAIQPAPSLPQPEQRTARQHLSLGRINLPPEADGDRILTTRGQTMLYLKDARWVATVPELMTQLLGRQFALRAPHIDLARTRGVGRGGSRREIDVDRFEARYELDDPDIAPVVRISGTATIMHRCVDQPDTKHFNVEVPASANSKSAIAAAFDSGAEQFARQLVDWTIVTAPREMDLAAGNCREAHRPWRARAAMDRRL